VPRRSSVFTGSPAFAGDDSRASWPGQARQRPGLTPPGCWRRR
jgi:hypothetical protein